MVDKRLFDVEIDPNRGFGLVKNSDLVRWLRRIQSKYIRIDVFSENGEWFCNYNILICQESRSGIKGNQTIKSPSQKVLLLPRLSDFVVRFWFENTDKLPKKLGILISEEATYPDFVDVNSFSSPEEKDSDIQFQSLYLTDNSTVDNPFVAEGNVSRSINVTVDVEDCYFRSSKMLESFSDLPTTSDISNLLSERGILGTFFVNVYEVEFSENKDKIKSVIRDLRDKGHEIGLHCHHHEGLLFYNKLITEYGYSGQRNILQYGKHKLEDIVGKRITSFRAGGYQHNDDTIAALSDLGFTVDSSILFPEHGTEASSIRYLNPYLDSSHDIVRIPVTPIIISGRYGGVKHSKFDVNWLEAKYLEQLVKGGSLPAHSNFMMHSFSFFNRTRINYKDRYEYEEHKVSPPNAKGKSIVVSGFNKKVFERFISFIDCLQRSGLTVETCSQTAEAVKGGRQDSDPYIPVIHR